MAAPPALAAVSASPLLPVIGSGGAVPVPVLAPAVPAVSGRKRSLSLICGSRESPLTPGLPKGPFPSDDAAVAAIKEWARFNSAGSFDVVRTSERKATSKAGTKVHVQCDCFYDPKPGDGGKRKRVWKGTSCKLGMVLEDVEEGWVVQDMLHPEMSNEAYPQNHSLRQTAEERAAVASMRGIPEWLDKLAGKLLKIAGQLVAMIHK